jgi:hypothetical protein
MEDSRVSEAKKSRQVWNKVKVMSTAFCDHEGVVHHEYAPDSQTVSKENYLEVFRPLLDAVWHKPSVSWKH